jgi:Tfp pilus assembly protein PilV
MKLLNNKWRVIKKTLRSRSGESIMEALVSLLILGLLLTTIVSIIRYSTAMTGQSMRVALIEQNTVNSLMLEDFTGRTTTTPDPELRFHATIGTTPSFALSVTHSVVFTTQDDLTAFYPVPPSGP